MAKILIIDDEQMTLDMLATFVEISGHQSLKAIDSRQGWSILDYETPEAILLDIQLPDMNGLHMCKELKQNAKTANLPVIMISAHFPPLIAEAEEAGADGYLAKPIKIQVLREKLNEYL